MKAAEIRLQSVTGAWFVESLVGTPPVSGEGAAELRWGTAHLSYNGDRSGIRFDATSLDGPYGPDVAFGIGTFTHMNNVITKGEYPGVVRLDLSISARFDDVLRTFTSSFRFSIWETLNLGSTCANGQANLVRGSVNENGCADRVQLLSNGGLSEEFKVGGKTYTFDLLGFADWGEDFWTVEQQDNTAHVQARFSVVEPSVVPLPAGAWLLLTGMVALGLARRRHPDRGA